MKGLVSKMFRENNSHNDLRKESLYSACDDCLKLLRRHFLRAAASGLQDVSQIARQADNLHWILDILIDRQIADTHGRTLELLESNSYFGMQPTQVTLLKQEKVACLDDNDARLALDPQNRYRIQTKPHGHGDVHSLLYSSGILKVWHDAGLKWVLIFQDTNGLLFKAIPSALGVSATKQYQVNSLAVPRL